MNIIDLHTHSTFSDGSDTPRQLVALAKQQGLAALAITDHDTIGAFRDAKDYAAQLGVMLYSGIEMSVTYRGGQMHLLGLGFDSETATFQAAYRRSRQPREACVDSIYRYLVAKGVMLSAEQLAPYIQEEMVDRYTFFRYFAAVSKRQDVQGIWDEYLDPALQDVAVDIPVQDAITMIKQAGGVTSLAHFHKTLGLKRFSQTTREDCIQELTAMGLDALEVRYPDYSPADQEFITAMATKYNLQQTGGTDFHGNYRPAVKLGTGINHNLTIPKEWIKFIPRR